MSVRTAHARSTALLAFASLTAFAAPASAGYLAPTTDPTPAPAYLAPEGLKIVIPSNPTAGPRKYVGHVTLIRREIGPPPVVSPDTGNVHFTSFFDIFADITFDDGVTYTRAQDLNFPIEFDFLPVIPPTPPAVPGTIEYKVKPKPTIQKPIILFTDGLANRTIKIRETPGSNSEGTFRTIFTSSQGPYQITSSLDYYVDLSLDNGQTWITTDAPLRLTAVPEPTSLATLLLALPLITRRR